MSKTALRGKIAQELPYLRRYSRALVGNQAKGDDLAINTLEAILSDESTIIDPTAIRESLFHVFHKIWEKTERVDVETGPGVIGQAMLHLSQLTANSREALLLKTIEKFDTSQIAMIMDIDVTTVDALLRTARDDMKRSITGQVLIIEDEDLIAQDLSNLVDSLGHSVTGVARTPSAAIALADKVIPHLILADIQLADDTSGIEAVRAVMERHGTVPVIYITAFPELLLTGKNKEPAFVIAKPYKEDQVQSAISQAMFFRSTETLLNS